MAMEAQWYREQEHEVHWGWNDKREHGWGQGLYDKIIEQPEGLPFLQLPHPDREFTRAKEYTSGNYKYTPGTHIMSSNSCWYGKCTFCVEKDGPENVTRSPFDVASELVEIMNLGFKEAFDDSGTFPTGKWLEEFCELTPAPCLTLGCNMRFGTNPPYKLMKQAGFRMLLYGLESANQSTLDRINKGIQISEVENELKEASQAGLQAHIAVMFGYPWETDKDAINTLNLTHYLLKKGYAKTAQASVFTQEGVPRNNKYKHYTKRIYNVKYNPQFWFNQLKDIRNKDDIKYLWRKIKAGLHG